MSVPNTTDESRPGNAVGKLLNPGGEHEAPWASIRKIGQLQRPGNTLTSDVSKRNDGGQRLQLWVEVTAPPHPHPCRDCHIWAGRQGRASRAVGSPQERADGGRGPESRGPPHRGRGVILSSGALSLEAGQRDRGGRNSRRCLNNKTVSGNKKKQVIDSCSRMGDSQTPFAECNKPSPKDSISIRLHLYNILRRSHTLWGHKTSRQRRGDEGQGGVDCKGAE